jgi:hypothetical protein
MPVGIEVINPSSRLMLTTLRANPMVRQSGSVATTGGSGVPGWSVLVLSYTNSSSSSHPIPFVKGDCTIIQMYGGKTGSTWTWTYLVNVAAGTNMPYFVFDEPSNTYGNNGIEIYADAPGLPLLFGMHSSLKPLRIAAVSSVAGSLPAGRTYAVAQNEFGIPDIDYWALVGYGDWVALASNNYSFGEQRLDPATSALPGTDSPNFADERDYPHRPAIFADVTGY